ncbi:MULTISPECIES: LuxE/PaaK family acyltransferase [Kitasatospora]|uniref:Acyl-protein synthetase n=1 Tax=Kitasatospora cystarginea TaxID=58350 RepID=A0ABN3DBF9_9ACTN
MTRIPTQVSGTQPSVPDPQRLRGLQLLFDTAAPFAAGPESDELFLGALREVNTWHLEHSPFYASLWAEAGRPDIDSTADLDRLPFVHASFLKRNEIRSVSEEQISLHLTSSGTSGQKSQVFLDKWSADVMQEMDCRVFDHYGWVDRSEEVNYLVYGYEPRPDLTNGATFGLGYVSELAPARSLTFGLRHTGTGHEFDPFGCILALQRYAEEGIPVRILGYPAFLHFTLERMGQLNHPPLKLSPRSLVFLGGGWKANADRQIPKDDLYAAIREQLGVPDHRIRDAYGSVEHPLPYFECERHNLHVPTWSRVLVRSVDTLRALPYGETGYLQFVSPFITSMPTHSIVMNDLGTLYAPEGCGCGLGTAYFTVHGRAGVSRNRSCAIAAAELLKAGS